MELGDVAFLTGIVLTFVIFAGALAWVSGPDQKRK